MFADTALWNFSNFKLFPPLEAFATLPICAVPKHIAVKQAAPFRRWEAKPEGMKEKEGKKMGA